MRKTMKRQLITIFAFLCVVIMSVAVQAQKTIKTRIGDLSFTHDFASGYPTVYSVSGSWKDSSNERSV